MFFEEMAASEGTYGRIDDCGSIPYPNSSFQTCFGTENIR